MPLPTGGPTPWPPAHCQAVNEQYTAWAAWWAGDVDQLAAVYGGGGDGRDTNGFFASQQGGFRAGARRAASIVRRWFWGDRSTGTQQRTRLHVPLAGDIPQASADLLFADPPTVVADDAGTGTPDEFAQARLDLLWDDNTIAVLLQAAEISAALGGVYLRLVWGPNSARPWITAMQPDVAVPEWQWGRLAAVTFGREVGRKGKTVWRHLEHHEPGRILHGLYQGEADKLGVLVPLTDHPATEDLVVGLVNGNEVLTGTSRLTVGYVPNMLPNRCWRGQPEAVNLGRPDIAGCEPLLDALDLTWSSWVRDIDLGKARLVVPQEYMQSHGAGAGASVDLDREVYEPISAMASESGDQIQIEQIQFAIRVDEHERSVDALKREIVGSAGYAIATLGTGAQDGQAVTATEIASRDRRSITTRAKKIRYWRSVLTDLLETWTHLDAHHYGSGIRPQRPRVEWPDAVSVDPLTQAQTLRELDTAGAISTEQKVRERRPDWDDDQVAAEVERIKADRGGGEDPELSLGRLAGNNPPPGEEPPEE